ncbi:hypothetical protein SDC9_97764 [bioreactor metagenome]|uniref:Uncharacterized protein n=1 Tax=bioreactor metagenome TaxID=1076179 RepID=A0A645AE88_9ZZZZ
MPGKNVLRPGIVEQATGRLYPFSPASHGAGKEKARSGRFTGHIATGCIGPYPAHKEVLFPLRGNPGVPFRSKICNLSLLFRAQGNLARETM